MADFLPFDKNCKKENDQGLPPSTVREIICHQILLSKIGKLEN